MSRAFKCDSCNEFKQGSPNRIKLSKYKSVGITGWTDRRTMHKMEICTSCESELRTMIKDILNDD